MFYIVFFVLYLFCSSRRRHTRCALVTGVQTCALPICPRWPDHRNPAQPSCLGRRGQRAECPATGGVPRNPADDPRPALQPGEQRRHLPRRRLRSEEHTSELQSLMCTSYAVFCLKKTKPKLLTTHRPDVNTSLTSATH